LRFSPYRSLNFPAKNGEFHTDPQFSRQKLAILNMAPNFPARKWRLTCDDGDAAILLALLVQLFVLVCLDQVLGPMLRF
jgi:hypothetical protein